MTSRLQFSNDLPKLALLSLFWSGWFNLLVHAQVGPPPIITLQPLSQSVRDTESAAFEVVASSATTMTYQWRKNGVNLPGATASTCTLSSVSPSDAADYAVLITNGGGSITSSPAALLVLYPPPSITIPPLISPGMTPHGFTFQFQAPVGSTQVILASTNLQDWVPIFTNLGLTADIVFTDTAAADYGVRFYRLGGPMAILQQNTSGGNKIDVKLGQKGAQSFRRGRAGEADYWISKVVIQLSRELDAPNAPLNFSIGFGINSGAIVGSSVSIRPESIADTSAGASFQKYEISFSTPVGPLTAGTNYYLNFECEASNGKALLVEYANSNTYPNGTYYKNGSNDKKDIRFEIWGQ